MLKASAGLADAFAERKACTRSGMRKIASSPKALNCGVVVVQALFGLALTLISLLFGDHAETLWLDANYGEFILVLTRWPVSRDGFEQF